MKFESRSLQIFLSSLNSEATKKDYLFWLDRFREHVQKKEYDGLLVDPPEVIQTEIENYVLELRRMRASRAAIKSSVYALFHFFAMNRVILNEKIIRKLVPEQEGKTGGGGAYSTEDVQKIINAVEQTRIKKHKKWYFTKPRAKALVHFIASSGVRLGAIPGLKYEDIEPMDDCYLVKVYAGTKYEYITFLTPEARIALDDYLRIISPLAPEDSLFGMDYDALRMCLYRLVRKANVSETKTVRQNDMSRRVYGERRPIHRLDIPTVHGLRKRWNTILKSNNEMNPNLIEMMLGHSTAIKLDESYLKPTPERLFEEYQKGIQDLTVFKIPN